LGGLLTDRYAKHETAGYPTICKGRFTVGKHSFYAIEEPTSLNTLALLPKLLRAGVKAIKIEGRQRTPAYVGQVTGVWRQAIDSCLRDPETYTSNAAWDEMLDQVSEGASTTLGPYYRPWQ
jgi:putative protease